MSSKLWNRFLLAGAWVACLLLFATGKGRAQSLQRQVEAEAKPLGIVSSLLQKAHRSAVIEYSGKCVRSSIIASPLILNKMPIQEEDAVNALKSLLSKDRRFSIESNANGLLVIKQYGIPQELLDLRIQKVEFSTEQQFDPGKAIEAVFRTPEVQSFMKRNKMSVANSWGGFVGMPGQDLPHLNQRIESTTVFGAVETILSTFPQLAIYRECSAADGNRIVSITFR